MTTAGKAFSVENGNLRVPENSNGRNLVAEAFRQPGQAIAGSYAEAVSSEKRIFKEACARARERTPVPRLIPGVRSVSVVPPFVTVAVSIMVTITVSIAVLSISHCSEQ